MSVGDQEVISHTISKEKVGKLRRGFPTGTRLKSQSLCEWYKGSMHEGGSMKGKRKRKM